jgi:hypothetical protein
MFSSFSILPIGKIKEDCLKEEKALPMQERLLQKSFD